MLISADFIYFSQRTAHIRDIGTRCAVFTFLHSIDRRWAKTYLPRLGNKQIFERFNRIVNAAQNTMFSCLHAASTSILFVIVCDGHECSFGSFDGSSWSCSSAVISSVRRAFVCVRKLFVANANAVHCYTVKWCFIFFSLTSSDSWFLEPHFCIRANNGKCWPLCYRVRSFRMKAQSKWHASSQTHPKTTDAER